MMRTLFPVSSLALCLALTACSSGSSDTVSTSQKASTATTTAGAPATPASPGLEDTEEDTATMPTVAAGQALAAPTHKIVVLSTRCGSDVSLKDGASNPAWQGDDSVPESIPYKAPAGKSLCVIRSRFTNTSSSPAGSDHFASVTIDGKQFEPSTEDTDASYRVNSASGAEFRINPGESSERVDVFTVPAGSRPSHATYAPTEIGTYPIGVMALPTQK